jgi:hypothetical protein
VGEATGRRTPTVRVGTPEAAFDAGERFVALAAEDRPEPLFEVVLQREEDLQGLSRRTSDSSGRYPGVSRRASAKPHGSSTATFIRFTTTSTTSNGCISSPSSGKDGPNARPSGTTTSKSRCRSPTASALLHRPNERETARARRDRPPLEKSISVC